MTFDRFVGVPWIEKGRGFNGCDCWGLVWLIYRELRGVELPSYGERYLTVSDRGALADLIDAEKLGQWREVADGAEHPFDAVLLREGRALTHIGIVTSSGRLLHVERGKTSAIENYRVSPLKFRLAGFYRHQTQ